jgi:hypothetical protein
MSILGGGGEIGFCLPFGSNVFETTLAGTFDATRSRCSINIGALGDTASYCLWNYDSATTTAWAGFMAYGARPGDAALHNWLALFTSAGVFKVLVSAQRKDGTGSLDTYLRIYYPVAGVWTQVGSTALINMALTKFDLNANVNSATGSIRLFANGALIIDSGSIDLTSIPDIGSITGISIEGPWYPSEMILADESTVRLRGRTDAITAAGPNTDWTGAAADIDETTYTDATGISSGSAGNISTYTASSPTLTGNPRAVLVGARGNLGSTGPTGLQLAIRPSATNYFSGTKTQAVGYGASIGIWETDPATGVAWLAAAASAAKPGVKSIA